MNEAAAIEKVQLELPKFSCSVNGIEYVFGIRSVMVDADPPYSPSIRVELQGVPKL